MQPREPHVAVTLTRKTTHDSEHRLHLVVSALARALTEQDVTRAVLDVGLNALDANAGYVAALEPGRSELRVLGSKGFKPEAVERWRQIALRASAPITEAVKGRELVFISSREELHTRFPRLQTPIASLDGGAVLAVPLLIDEVAVGGLCLAFPDERDLVEAERKLVLEIADAAARTLERATSYEHEREARTAAEGAQRRLGFLAEANAILDQSLDPTTTMERLAGIAVPDLGELCIIDLLADDGRIEGAVVAIAEDPETAKDLERLRELHPIDPDGSHPVARALRDGTSQLVPEMPDDLLQEIAEGEEHLAFMRRLAYSSAVVAPLRARGRTLGALSVLHLGGDKRHDAGDMAFVEDLARRAATALDNARLYEQLRRKEESERFLRQSTWILSTSLDYEETLRRVAATAVPEIADWCAVEVLDPKGAIKRVALEHVDPLKVAKAFELTERYPPGVDDTGGPAQVIRTGVAELYPEISEEMLASSARDADHLSALRELQMRSAMIVPMQALGRSLGAMTFVSGESGRRFDETDLAVAEELGRAAGVAIENARLYRERSHIAQTLQQSLLPPELPEIPGVEMAARYRPAGEGYDVGGDFYDVFPCRRSWALVIGDVCGKGPEAAALTALTRYTIRAAAVQSRQPTRVLRTLNDAILAEQSDHRFCSAIFARLELRRTPRLLVANAGHPSALRMSRSGKIEALPGQGDLLGVFPQPRWTEYEVGLMPGDTLIFYTDGVIEARAPEHILESQHLSALLSNKPEASPAEIIETIEQAATAGQEPRDDLALLVIRIGDDVAAPRRFSGAGR